MKLLYGRAFLGSLLLLSCSHSAFAQFTQYRPPGDFKEQRESTDELLERSMQEARWRLGALLVDPWLSLRDAAYINEPEPFGSDVTATVGAGLRAYLPIGSQTTLAIHGLPEYNAYFENTERNQLNFSYGFGLFANFGRIGMEVSARQQERDDFFSNELNRRITSQISYGVVSLEVDLGRGASIFGAAEPRHYRFPESTDFLDQALLDQERDEDVFRAGLRLTLPRGLSIALGAEASEADFESETVDRSNSGVAPILQAHYDAHPFYFDLSLALRDLEPEPGSIFVRYNEPSGDFSLGWRTSPRWQLQLFGSSNLVYSLDTEWVYYQDDSIGLAAQIGLSSNTSFRVFYELGANDYTGNSSAPAREEDLNTIGGEVDIHLGRGIVMRLSARETRYTPISGGRRRNVTYIAMGLSFGSGSGSPWG
jgi:hypothetical protein